MRSGRACSEKYLISSLTTVYSSSIVQENTTRPLRKCILSGNVFRISQSIQNSRFEPDLCSLLSQFIDACCNQIYCKKCVAN